MCVTLGGFGDSGRDLPWYATYVPPIPELHVGISRLLIGCACLACSTTTYLPMAVNNTGAVKGVERLMAERALNRLAKSQREA
jgi:hypothetical protein